MSDEDKSSSASSSESEQSSSEEDESSSKSSESSNSSSSYESESESSKDSENEQNGDVDKDQSKSDSGSDSEESEKKSEENVPDSTSSLPVKSLNVDFQINAEKESDKSDESDSSDEGDSSEEGEESEESDSEPRDYHVGCCEKEHKHHHCCTERHLHHHHTWSSAFKKENVRDGQVKSRCRLHHHHHHACEKAHHHHHHGQKGASKKNTLIKKSQRDNLITRERANSVSPALMEFVIGLESKKDQLPQAKVKWDDTRTTAEQLIEFAKEANIPMLKYYFKNVRPKQPDEDIESALDTCVRSSIALGNVEMLHLLIENGASVDGMDDGDATPLMLALELGQNECAKELLEDGADPNQSNIHIGPLHLATQMNMPDMVKLLLDKGVYADRRDAKSGKTPLHIAIELRHYHVAMILLAAGADVTYQAVGENVLHTAVRLCEDQEDLEFVSKVIRLLVKYPKEINTPTEKTGDTLLHLAAANAFKSFEITKMLLRFSPNARIKNFAGSTPLQIAQRRHNLQVEALLNKYLKKTADMPKESNEVRRGTVWARPLADETDRARKMSL